MWLLCMMIESDCYIDINKWFYIFFFNYCPKYMVYIFFLNWKYIVEIQFNNVGFNRVSVYTPCPVLLINWAQGAAAALVVEPQWAWSDYGERFPPQWLPPGSEPQKDIQLFKCSYFVNMISKLIHGDKKLHWQHSIQLAFIRQLNDSYVFIHSIDEM